jgi:hypothetical protein
MTRDLWPWDPFPVVHHGCNIIFIFTFTLLVWHHTTTVHRFDT